jgi:hypothetical protein
LLLKAFTFGEFLSFINACGIDPAGRHRRSNAKAFVLRQKKETKDKAVEQLWTALAGPEGIKAKLLQKATPDRSTALALNSFSWSEG